MNIREAVKDKKRIVIKIGSSSLMHNETGRLNLGKIEKLVRTIVDIKNSGTSGCAEAKRRHEVTDYLLIWPSGSW